MKLSNKILIAFAASLILIPVFGMVFVSATKYKTGTQKEDYFSIQQENNKSFDAKSEGKTAVKIDEPYQSINIIDANGSSIELHLNKDKNYGAKIADDLKELINFKVSNGILNISFKEGFKKEDFRQRVIIVLYAPSFNGLKANKLNNLHLTVSVDDLSVDLTDCTFFALSKGEVTSTTVVNGDTTAHDVFNQTAIKNLTLTLNHSEFSMGDLNLNTLNIITSNNSTVKINEEDEERSKSISIGSLNLKTNGSGEIRIGKVVVENAKGDFSDSTKLQIPAYLLNQMYNKK